MLTCHLFKGDSLTYQVGMNFSTKDQDNDEYTSGSCAEVYKGAWWHKACYYSNLNGFHFNSTTMSHGKGIQWYTWTGFQYSLKSVEMKIRPYP